MFFYLCFFFYANNNADDSIPILNNQKFIDDYNLTYVTLRNGLQMPILGYGVYKIPPEETEKCVLDAINVGYRLIDTDRRYGNEDEVGNAIVHSGVPRHELFITTKIWPTDYHNAKENILISLKKLKVDYIDLVLLHQPFGDYYSAWRDLEDLYQKGKIKAIGVSNFHPDRLIDLCYFSRISPMINQIETHIFYQQEEAHQWMLQLNVQHQSWGSLSEYRIKDLMKNPILTLLGKKYNKSPIQIALRYNIQRGIVVIPKTIQKRRMIHNFDVFNFSLTSFDMDQIRGLDQNQSLILSHRDPEFVLTKFGHPLHK